MHAGRNASCGRGGSTAGSGEATSRCGESKMSGIGHGGDGECAVVAGHADAAGGHQLPSDESMGADRLDGGDRGGSSAASRSGESRSASNKRKLGGRWHRDDRKRPVVGGDSDSRDSYGLSGRESMRGGGINGYE